MGLRDSEHSLLVVHYLLINMLAASFPEQRTHRASDSKWYSANGFRVRGSALEKLPSWANHCFLFDPFVERRIKKQYANMQHLKSNLCLNLRFEWYPLETISICSDSTLAAPAFIFALAFELRKCIRLVWAVAYKGAGATELINVWKKAPECDYAMTILNCNDVFKDCLLYTSPSPRD